MPVKNLDTLTITKYWQNDMIPIRDKNPSGTFPYVTISIIVLNVSVFLYEISLGPNLNIFLMTYGVVPLKVKHFSIDSDVTFINTFFPFISSPFLHGGFIHLIGNMWFLWIFGDNIEDKLGHFKFIIFYVICGITASYVHIIFNSQSNIPCIGASGAIAGVLGAYMVTFPYARIITIVPLFIFIQIIELPAMIVLGFWFVIQFFFGTASMSTSGGGVAWWAHIGGFASGIIMFYVIRMLFVRAPKNRIYQ